MEQGDYKAYNKAIECWICKKPFFSKKASATASESETTPSQKVKDHCHISGKYRGPAHDACNKKLQMGAFKTKVPLICHNFQGYDLIEVVSRFASPRI